MTSRVQPVSDLHALSMGSNQQIQAHILVANESLLCAKNEHKIRTQDFQRSWIGNILLSRP